MEPDIELIKTFIGFLIIVGLLTAISIGIMCY